MQQNQNAGSNSQSSANETHNNVSSLVDIKPIEGTPFCIVKQENKYFAVMGDHRITDVMNSEEEVFNKFIEEPWKITVTLIAIVVEKFHKHLEEIAIVQNGKEQNKDNEKHNLKTE